MLTKPSCSRRGSKLVGDAEAPGAAGAWRRPAHGSGVLHLRGLSAKHESPVQMFSVSRNGFCASPPRRAAVASNEAAGEATAYHRGLEVERSLGTKIPVNLTPLPQTRASTMQQ